MGVCLHLELTDSPAALLQQGQWHQQFLQPHHCSAAMVADAALMTRGTYSTQS
jgi:hypothetical protein